jgi:acetylglutamate kinase
MSRIFPQCLDADYSDRSARADVLVHGKSQTRKRTKKKKMMKETSRTMRVTTAKRMTEATRCGCAVCVSGEG